MFSARDFWREVWTEDFETLYEKKGITKLFANCPYDAYHDYRRYVGRRHKEEKTAKHTVRRCRRNPEIFLISYRRKKAAHLK